MSRTVLSTAPEETAVTTRLAGGRGEALIANRNEVYLLGWQKCSEIRQWWWLHYSVNILKTTEFYTLKGCVSWCMDYMSTKVLCKKKDDDDSGKKLRKCACKWVLNIKYKNTFISSIWICLCFRATPRKELFCVSTLQGLVPQKVFSKLRRPTRLTGRSRHPLHV